VLEVLALQPGGVVSPDRPADALWGEDVPKTWPNVVQGCVTRLRRTLGPSAIETSGDGYRIAVAADYVDSGVFEQLVERGRALALMGEADRASVTFARALALWRGPAFGNGERDEPCRSRGLMKGVARSVSGNGSSGYYSRR
jgi:DNA-binding SARP family transcriptional activator